MRLCADRLTLHLEIAKRRQMVEVATKNCGIKKRENCGLKDVYLRRNKA